ncbi:MAG: hypothetical protein R3E21_02685 [Caenibius sp.]
MAATFATCLGDRLSTLDVLGSLFYLCAMMAALAAARWGHQARRPFSEAGHWFAVAAFLAALALSRVLQVEENMQQALRHMLVTGGQYQGRGAFQSVLAAVCLLGIGLAAFIALRSLVASPAGSVRRCLAWSRLAILAMVGLIGLRMISYHPVDALLYGGPHLNRVIDVGATLAIGWAALAYCIRVRVQARP